jgi:hypothetical protein
VFVHLTKQSFVFRHTTRALIHDAWLPTWARSET